MKILFPIIFLLLGFPLSGQQNLTGLWKGTITQNEGGYRSSYSFELFIQQKGKEITGRSYVFVDDIHATMEITGTIHSNVYLMMEDHEILNFKVSEGMEWCLKNYQLVLKTGGGMLRLEGFWQGNTSFSKCIPGKVFLEKVVPRA